MFSIAKGRKRTINFNHFQTEMPSVNKGNFKMKIHLKNCPRHISFPASKICQCLTKIDRRRFLAFNSIQTHKEPGNSDYATKWQCTNTEKYGILFKFRTYKGIIILASIRHPHNLLLGS